MRRIGWVGALLVVACAGSGLEARSVLVDTGGRVWLDLRTGDRDVWEIVSRSGVVGRVRLPDSTRLLAAGEDHLWGVTLDRFDVPTVTKFVLIRANGP